MVDCVDAKEMKNGNLLDVDFKKNEDLAEPEVPEKKNGSGVGVDFNNEDSTDPEVFENAKTRVVEWSFGATETEQIKFLKAFLTSVPIASMGEVMALITQIIKERSGPGNDFTIAENSLECLRRQLQQTNTRKRRATTPLQDWDPEEEDESPGTLLYDYQHQDAPLESITPQIVYDEEVDALRKARVRKSKKSPYARFFEPPSPPRHKLTEAEMAIYRRPKDGPTRKNDQFADAEEN